MPALYAVSKSGSRDATFLAQCLAREVNSDLFFVPPSAITGSLKRHELIVDEHDEGGEARRIATEAQRQNAGREGK